MKKVRGILLRVIYKMSDGLRLDHKDLIKFIYEALNLDLSNSLKGSYQVPPPFRLKYVQRKNNELVMYVSFLDEQFAARFMEQVVQWGRLKLGNLTYGLKACEEISSESLPTDWNKEGVFRFIALEFATPTFFQTGKIALPLPLPKLVWGSLAKSFEAYAEAQLPENTRDDIEKYVTVQGMDIRTEKAVFSNYISTVGFVGVVEFRIEPEAPAYVSQILTTLAKWAEFVGVGSKTMYGMGVARVAEHPARLRMAK